MEIAVDSGAMSRGAVRGDPDPEVGVAGVDVGVGVGVGSAVDVGVGVGVDVGVNVGSFGLEPATGLSGVDWPHAEIPANETISATPSVRPQLPMVRSPLHQTGT